MDAKIILTPPCCVVYLQFISAPFVEKLRKHHILLLIERGESQYLDFKFAINDSVKIARSLVAFSNSDGGTLLIGVKDNGVIAGVRTAEEYYMVEAAAQMYTEPPVFFSSKEWNVSGKKVLEVKVSKSEYGPHSVIEPDGSRKLYLRIGDSNVMANRLIKSFMKLRQRHKGGYLSFGDHEKQILTFLSENESITIDQVKAMVGISREKVEKILINLLLMNVVMFAWDGFQFVFRIKALPAGSVSQGF
ncbi:MAG: ATP-binding protein [Bacteroidetes bacterium HGW-Bacteroidetes-22]|nr:MAG: ATP-binding protein [Bacteroidetes bacterium HGW-Bacteroidetes-22]